MISYFDKYKVQRQDIMVQQKLWGGSSSHFLILRTIDWYSFAESSVLWY